MVVPKAILSLMLLCAIWISWSAASPRPQNKDAFDEPNCGGEMGQPLITPCKDSIKLDSPSNYTLQCEADEPIEWIFNYEVQRDVVYFTNTEDLVRPYGIRLFLVEVTAIQVGAYYCIKKSVHGTDQIYMRNEELIESVNNNQANSIYIYVNDPNALLAVIPPIINAFQYTEVIIPCKPAMPETEVLLSFNGENHSTDEISSIAPTPTLYDFFNKSIYDAKIGFKLYIVSQPPSLIKCNAQSDHSMMTIYFTIDGGEYICEPKDPAPKNEEEVTVIDVRFIGNGHIDKANHRLNTPFITSTSRGHVYQNDTFELICEISAPPQLTIDIEWKMPKGVDRSRVTIINPDMANHSKNNTHKTAHSILTVKQAQITDTGAYKCTAKDAFNGEKFSSYRIRVMERQSSYLEVREPSNNYNVRDHANKTIIMTASFEGFPEPTFKWYKPNGIEIWETEPNFKIISTEFSTTLKLLSAQLENSGTYKLKGTNGINSKQLEFNVSVISGPELTMDDVYVQEGRQAQA